MPFTKVGNKYESPSGRKFTPKQVKMYYATNGFTKKTKVIVNNKLKGALGSSEFNGKKPTGKIEINVKAHKGDKKELASTIKHELTHVKHPKMTEKEVYKKTAKTKIEPKEQDRLIAKLKHGGLSYKIGALKRKYKVDSDEPGSFISKINEAKELSRREVSIRGLI